MPGSTHPADLPQTKPAVSAPALQAFPARLGVISELSQHGFPAQTSTCVGCGVGAHCSQHGSHALLLQNGAVPPKLSWPT